MKRTFEVLNVKCEGCAHTLKSKLAEEFGEVEVDLSVHPRTVTLDIDEARIDALRAALKKLGYPMADESLSGIENAAATAKSFVSCAIGKWENATKD